MRQISSRLVLVAVLVAVAWWLGPQAAAAQDKPRPGGELIFTVPSEPGSLADGPGFMAGGVGVADDPVPDEGGQGVASAH